MSLSECPDRETLAALNAGLLSGEALAAVAAHLDDCPACLARAQAVSPETDPLVSVLCRPGSTNPFVREPGCDQVVARLQALVDAGLPPDPATLLSPGGPTPEAASRTANDGSRYRPLRLHAHGGLGEVHVALDEELSREVALKRIRGSRASDSESRRRFLQEAEVTARLEHPGVVPVYGLVRDASGHPCYAMRFIQGETLQEALTRFHARAPSGNDLGSPPGTLRDLLNRFVAVCNTIAYAHSKGVLHRDLKPANVMLGPYGETLVVDWGLAKVVTGDPRPEARQDGASLSVSPPASSWPLATTEGQALGTPAYMSPEQAEGRMQAIGPATDIYGLGATLYAILTGQPPFEGQTAEILDQVRRGKVPSARTKKKEVSPPLEAICRKAMATRTEDRYPTVLALKADVEHWLADEPISVYRGTPIERLGRWGRRHRTVVIAALAVGLATLFGVSLLAWQSERGRQQLAEEQVATEIARQQAVEASRQAEANAKRERQAIRDYFVRSAENPAWKAVGLEPLRRKLLEEAKAYFQEFLRSHRDDPDLIAELAEVHSRLGNILAELGDRQQALEELESALNLQQRLTAAQPDEPKFRWDQARNWSTVGRLRKDLGQGQPSREAHERAIALAQQLYDEHPGQAESLRVLSACHGNHGELLKVLGDNPGARQALERALDFQERLMKLHVAGPGDWHSLGSSYNDLGVLLRSRFSDLPGAKQNYERARDVLEDLVKRHPLVPAYRWDLAMTHNNLGVLYEHLDLLDLALRAHERSLELNQRLHAEHPSVPEYRRDLAMNHMNLGLYWRDQADFAGARREIQLAIGLREPLMAMYPTVPDYTQDLSRCYKSLGMVLIDLKELPAAEEAMEKARTLREQIVNRHPDLPEYRALLADAYTGLASVRHRRGNNEGRRQANVRAVELSAELVTKNPGALSYALNLWAACFNLANQAREEGQWQTAVDWSSRAIQSLGGPLRTRLDGASVRRLSTTHDYRAVALARLGRHAEAVKDWEEAISLDKNTRHHGRVLNRGLSLAWLGEHARAVKDAEAALTGEKPPSEVFYASAQIHAVAAENVGQDSRIPGAEKEKLTREYGEKAMDLLKRARQAGFKDGRHLRNDETFRLLRAREDYQKLLTEIEGAQQP